MSELLESLKALTNVGPRRCVLMRIHSTLTPEEQEGLTVALDSSTVSGHAIYRALRKSGHKLGHDAVGCHRRHDCACYLEGD